MVILVLVWLVIARLRFVVREPSGCKKQVHIHLGPSRVQVSHSNKIVAIASKMKPSVLFLTGINGAIAVMLGAFGAHALKPGLTESGMLHAWETATHYHLAHAVACLGLLAWSAACPNRANQVRWIAFSWLFGCLLFAGSLYWLALGGPRFLGPITPIGGLAFIAGWALVAKEAFHRKTP
jgi:uncharacterized membrane protein YgdD (TMEM256/DUF423 family)